MILKILSKGSKQEHDRQKNDPGAGGGQQNKTCFAGSVSLCFDKAVAGHGKNAPLEKLKDGNFRYINEIAENNIPARAGGFHGRDENAHDVQKGQYAKAYPQTIRQPRQQPVEQEKQSCEEQNIRTKKMIENDIRETFRRAGIPRDPVRDEPAENIQDQTDGQQGKPTMNKVVPRFRPAQIKTAAQAKDKYTRCDQIKGIFHRHEARDHTLRTLMRIRIIIIKQVAYDHGIDRNKLQQIQIEDPFSICPHHHHASCCARKCDFVWQTSAAISLSGKNIKRRYIFIRNYADILSYGINYCPSFTRQNKSIHRFFSSPSWGI